MPSSTPGGRVAVLAAKTYRKEQNEKARKNRQRRGLHRLFELMANRVRG